MKAIGIHAYQLEVPKGTWWHNVVHTTLLKPFCRRDKAQDMEEDEEDVYEVESIIAWRKNRGVVKYRVRRVGYTEFKDTWETFDKLENCALMAQEFREKYPNKAQDEFEVWQGKDALRAQVGKQHGTFYPLCLSPFPTWFFGKRQLF